MMLIALGLLLLVVTGCEHLVVYEEDTAGIVTGKVATRTLLGLTTIGLSEMGVATFKDRLEGRPYPVTTGFHTRRPLSSQPLRFLVTGNHLLATAEMQQILLQAGNIVVERKEIGAIQQEQSFHLRQATDRDADLLHVGRLSGAERMVFVDATVRPAQFGISLIPHYALAVMVRAVNTETGQISWQGSATYSAPTADLDTGIGSLTRWAVARAVCQEEAGDRWIEPGPYRHEAGCLRAAEK